MREELMKRGFYVLMALLVGAALLAACGGGATSQGSGTGAGQTGGTATTGGAASAAGDPEAGKTLFAAATVGNNPGCTTCHSLDGSNLVGPSMQGIGTRAATRVSGESAEQYLRTAITDPNVHVVEGFAQGVMPSYKTAVSDTQLSDLVAYLLTLK
jgi:mono/diheme cytochrome c family protein